MSILTKLSSAAVYNVLFSRESDFRSSSGHCWSAGVEGTPDTGLLSMDQVLATILFNFLNRIPLPYIP
jgi:hypothetical protein